MFAELFLPDTQLLSFEEIKIDKNSIMVRVASARDCAKCPYCQASATRTHSRHLRTLSDLPCGERTVQIQWEAKRYFCDNYDCLRLTFCEQLPEVTARYARKTIRPGQPVRFLYVLGQPGVQAWDCLPTPQHNRLDVTRYIELLLRAAETALKPIGVAERDLRNQMFESCAVHQCDLRSLRLRN